MYVGVSCGGAYEVTQDSTYMVAVQHQQESLADYNSAARIGEVASYECGDSVNQVVQHCTDFLAII